MAENAPELVLNLFGCSVIPLLVLDGDNVVALGVAIEPAGQAPPGELPELVAALVPEGAILFCLKMRPGTAVPIAGTIAGTMVGDSVVSGEVETGTVLMTCPFWVHIRTEPEIWHSPEATPALGCPTGGAVKLGTGDVAAFVLESVGAGDVPAFVFARPGAGEVPALVLGTAGAVSTIEGIDGCGTSGGIGVESRGWSAETGELGGDVPVHEQPGSPALHGSVTGFPVCRFLIPAMLAKVVQGGTT